MKGKAIANTVIVLAAVCAFSVFVFVLQQQETDKIKNMQITLTVTEGKPGIISIDCGGFEEVKTETFSVSLRDTGNGVSVGRVYGEFPEERPLILTVRSRADLLRGPLFGTCTLQPGYNSCKLEW